MFSFYPIVKLNIGLSLKYFYEKFILYFTLIPYFNFSQEISISEETFNINITSDILFNEFINDINTNLGLNYNYKCNLIRTDKDIFGISHSRYSVYYRNRELYGNQIIFHLKDNKIKSINGEIYSINEYLEPNLKLNDIKNIINSEFNFINELNDISLVYFKNNGVNKLCYKVGIKENSILAKEIIINATNGEILLINDQLNSGKANTSFSGTVNINSNFYNNLWYLADTNKHIQALNGCNETLAGSPILDDDNSGLKVLFLRVLQLMTFMQIFNKIGVTVDDSYGVCNTI